jgi:hypothetical protein
VFVPCGVHFLFLPAFLAQYTEHHQDRVSWDRELVAAFRSELRGLHYEPDLSGWDNTILIPVESLTYPMVAVAPGMGVNCVIDWPSLGLPPRSRYLLMPEKEVVELSRRTRLRRLRLTRMGWLCINPDASEAAALEERLHDDRHGQ